MGRRDGIGAVRRRLRHLEVDDDCDCCGELVHLFQQFVLKDDPTTGTCSDALQAAVVTSRNPNFPEVFAPHVAVEEPAAEVMRWMPDGGGNAVPAPAANAQPAVWHAEIQVTHNRSCCLKFYVFSSIISLCLAFAFSVCV